MNIFAGKEIVFFVAVIVLNVFLDLVRIWQGCRGDFHTRRKALKSGSDPCSSFSSFFHVCSTS